MKISNRTFEGVTVDLDENLYFDCTFKDCTLRYTGGALPHLENCRFEGGSFAFEKGAGNTVEFLRELYHSGLRHNVEAFFEDIRRNPPGGGPA